MVRGVGPTSALHDPTLSYCPWESIRTLRYSTRYRNHLELPR